MTCGCRRFIEEAFGEFGLHRVSLLAAATNLRSQAVAERLGMTREAVLREAERTTDGYHDMVVFSILEHEWPSA